MRVNDGRLPPFCWIANDAMRMLHEQLSGKELNTALGIYSALAYMASVKRDGEHTGFEATRRELSEAAGVTPRTLDHYGETLEGMGLLRVVRRRNGEVNLPNEWVLLDVAWGGATHATTPLAQPTTLPSNDTRVVRSNDTHKEEEELQEVSPLASLGDPGEDSEVILDEEADRFCRYLAAAASEAAGTTRRVEKHWLAPARELLDKVPKAELRAVVDWAHTRPYWVTKVRTMPMLKDAWPRVRAEWATAQKKQGSAKSSARQERTRRRLAYAKEE